MTDLFYRIFIFWYVCGAFLLTFNILPPWLEWANTVFLMLAGIVAGIYFTQRYGLITGEFIVSLLL
ncbi:hypothetical protein MUN89_15025 [Halobacillus salinarum]|uniref:Uncharacterized protein n=1 Tax=Halobacillus salinarum TaxID=2932257 RepID=A0ABY4EQ29_9BACI|nr:hypothetical protein [Halobacillus salinarum]UOQ46566.1 hypothetical protein MUN89_15025 [Halobacillus salinarum]